LLPTCLYVRLHSYWMGYQNETSNNLVEGHPQLSHNRLPVDGALVGVGSLWLRFPYFGTWN
jgi:hypothetical protein